MVSFADKRKGNKTSAAKVTKTDTVPEITLIVPDDSVKPFIKDERLISKKPVVEFLRAVLNLGETETTLTDDQIWVGAKTVNGKDLDPQEHLEAVLDYLNSLQSTKSEPLDDVTRQKVLNSSQSAAYAAELGAKADKQLAEHAAAGLDGKLAWDNCPLVIAETDLIRLYKDDLPDMPIVGTDKTNRTHKKTGASKNNVPDNYQGPTDKFIAMVDGEPKVQTWTRIWIETMPHVAPLLVQRKTIAAIKAGTNVAAIPKDWAENCPPQMKAINNQFFDGVDSDLQTEISRQVNRITTALAFWQSKYALDKKLPDVGYKYVDDTAEASATRTKPIQMLARVEIKGKAEWIPSGKPVTLSQFNKFARFADKCQAQGGSLAKLLELSKAKKTAQSKAPTKEIENAIDKVGTFKTVLSNVFTYAENHEGMVKATLSDPRDGGELAYWIRQVGLSLQNLWDNPAVIKLATDYDKRQLEGRAAEIETVKDKAAA